MIREIEGILDEFSQLVDIALVSAAFYAVVDLYEAKQVINSHIPLSYFLIFLSYLLFGLLGTSINRLYRSRRFTSLKREIRLLAQTHFFSFAFTLIFLNLYDPQLIKNRFIFYFVAIAFGLTLAMHMIIRLCLQSWRKSGRNTRYCLMLGSGAPAKLFLEKAKASPQLGLKVIGYLAPQNEALGIPYYGSYSQLENILEQEVIDTTVVTASVSDEGIEESIDLLNTMGKNVVIMLDRMVSKVALSRPVDFSGLSMVAFDGHPRRPWQALSKELLDVAASGIGLLVISPLMLAIAIAIKATSKGPVFFAQERVGLNGRIFKMYKFRSMVVNAEELKAALADHNEMSGPVFKIKNDPRVTPVGRFLRKTSLDELPQLWNVFRQDMSLVGPRPPLPKEVNLYDPRHRKRLTVKPGITCIWQISGRNDVDFEQWMDMDAEYVDRWSFKLDMEILLKTVPVVLLRKGAS
mgnify:CR=1 FL=1